VRRAKRGHSYLVIGDSASAAPKSGQLGFGFGMGHHGGSGAIGDRASVPFGQTIRHDAFCRFWA